MCERCVEAAPRRAALYLHEKALRKAARLEHVALLELGRRTHVKDEVRPLVLGHRLFLVHHDPRAEVGLRAVDGNVLHGVVCLVLLMHSHAVWMGGRRCG